MDKESIKLAHENFVTGHDGSSPLDIILTVFPVIPGTFSAIVLTDGKINVYNFCVQYLLCIVPVILSFTILSNSTLYINVFMFLIACASWVCSTKTNETYHLPIDKNKSLYLPYLTSCRSTVFICTCIAILAVDFHCFPRRFAKTEHYGYGLMDLGVSCFVFLHGAFDKISKRRSWNGLSILVLLALGFLRLLSVKATNYQHHVTEYGMHANFFFTLAALKILCSWWSQSVTIFSGLSCSVVIVSMHQYVLCSGVANWTLSDSPRDSMLSANREFFVSIPGYVVIYILGSVTAACVYNRLEESSLKQNLTLALATSLAVLLLALLEHSGFPPSRRLANPPFVIWTVVFVLFFLMMFKIMESTVQKIGRKPFAPVVFECVNCFPLLFFLGANLLTGLVNFVVDTMTVTCPLDVVIINIYVLSVLLAVYLLFIRKSKSRTIND